MVQATQSNVLPLRSCYMKPRYVCLGQQSLLSSGTCVFNQNLCEIHSRQPPLSIIDNSPLFETDNVDIEQGPSK